MALKEKLIKFYEYMTAHPLSFSRMLGIFGIGVVSLISFLVAQVVLWVLSGWLIFAEIILFFLWLAMLATNAGREEDLKRKKRGW